MTVNDISTIFQRQLKGWPGSEVASTADEASVAGHDDDDDDDGNSSSDSEGRSPSPNVTPPASDTAPLQHASRTQADSIALAVQRFASKSQVQLMRIYGLNALRQLHEWVVGPEPGFARKSKDQLINELRLAVSMYR